MLRLPCPHDVEAHTHPPRDRHGQETDRALATIGLGQEANGNRADKAWPMAKELGVDKLLASARMA